MAPAAFLRKLTVFNSAWVNINRFLVLLLLSYEQRGMKEMRQQRIIENTLAYINSHDDSEEAFNQQALMLFEYQYKNNSSY